MIKFVEHTSSEYLARTAHNVRISETTLAFAVDFKTAGEVATKNLCSQMGKPHIAVDLNTYEENNAELYQRIAKNLSVFKVKVLNIAGNGIYTLKHKYSQEAIDQKVSRFLNNIHNIYPIEVLVSGGQTGVDEAGLKWGDSAGIETICTAPKGWKFRNLSGQDVCDVKLFKTRFHYLYDIIA